jgi:acyl-coenzyme A thioesterase PaaI-like protein
VSGALRISVPGSLQPPADAVLPPRHPDAPAAGSLVPVHYEQCFGCGPAHPTGLRVQTVAGTGLDVRATFRVTEHHQGAPGLAHGGALAAAFDEVLGALGWLLLVPMVTGRLQTEFLRPVPVGSEVTMSARVDGVDGRRVFCSGEGTVGDTAVVRAWAVFVQVPREHFRRHGRPVEDTGFAGPGLAVNP